MKSFCELL